MRPREASSTDHTVGVGAKKAGALPGLGAQAAATAARKALSWKLVAMEVGVEACGVRNDGEALYIAPWKSASPRQADQNCMPGH